MALSVPDRRPNPVFNIGSGVETSLNDLYGMIAGILDVKPAPIYHPDRPGEQIRYCLDATKAKRELGWSPVVSLEDGLRARVKAHVTV